MVSTGLWLLALRLAHGMCVHACARVHALFPHVLGPVVVAVLVCSVVNVPLFANHSQWARSPTQILLVLSLVSTSAQFVSSAALTYPATDMSTDIWGFLSLICVCSAVGAYLFLLTAKNCWARINGTSITKVWPGDPWIQTHSGPASPCQTGAR